MIQDESSQFLFADDQSRFRTNYSVWLNRSKLKPSDIRKRRERGQELLKIYQQGDIELWDATIEERKISNHHARSCMQIASLTEEQFNTLLAIVPYTTIEDISRQPCWFVDKFIEFVKGNPNRDTEYYAKAITKMRRAFLLDLSSGSVHRPVVTKVAINGSSEQLDQRGKAETEAPDEEQSKILKSLIAVINATKIDMQVLYDLLGKEINKEKIYRELPFLKAPQIE